MKYSKSFSINKDTNHDEILLIHDSSDSFGTRYLVLRLETKQGGYWYAYLSQNEGEWVNFDETQIKQLILGQVFTTHSGDNPLRFKTLAEVKTFLKEGA